MAPPLPLEKVSLSLFLSLSPSFGTTLVRVDRAPLSCLLPFPGFRSQPSDWCEDSASAWAIYTRRVCTHASRAPWVIVTRLPDSRSWEEDSRVHAALVWLPVVLLPSLLSSHLFCFSRVSLTCTYIYTIYTNEKTSRLSLWSWMHIRVQIACTTQQLNFVFYSLFAFYDYRAFSISLDKENMYIHSHVNIIQSSLV